MRSAKYFFLFILAVAIFLAVRYWLDRKREAIQQIDIVRKDLDLGDSHLGSWAMKNDTTLTIVRFRRDGFFSCQHISYLTKDTIKEQGRFSIITSYVDEKGLHYPRIIAISDQGDTLFNHFLHITRATKKNVDILVLQPNENTDSLKAVFYRIKQ